MGSKSITLWDLIPSLSKGKNMIGLVNFELLIIFWGCFSPWIDWNLYPCQMTKLGFEFKERRLKVKKSVLVNTDIFSPILILMLNICFLFLWSVMSFLKVKKKKRKKKMVFFFYQSLYSWSAWFFFKSRTGSVVFQHHFHWWNLMNVQVF